MAYEAELVSHLLLHMARNRSRTSPEHRFWPPSTSLRVPSLLHYSRLPKWTNPTVEIEHARTITKLTRSKRKCTGKGPARPSRVKVIKSCTVRSSIKLISYYLWLTVDTLCPEKSNPCIHCLNSGKQCRILTEFWTNDAMLVQNVAHNNAIAKKLPNLSKTYVIACNSYSRFSEVIPKTKVSTIGNRSDILWESNGDCSVKRDRYSNLGNRSTLTQYNSV